MSKEIDELRSNDSNSHTWRVLSSVLEKSIPKQPTEVRRDAFVCKSCGYLVGKEGNDLDWHKEFFPHCQNCGQEMDWNIEEKGISYTSIRERAKLEMIHYVKTLVDEEEALESIYEDFVDPIIEYNEEDI